MTHPFCKGSVLQAFLPGGLWCRGQPPPCPACQPGRLVLWPAPGRRQWSVHQILQEEARVPEFWKQRFSWSFVIAKTPVAILGSDFLLGHALAVDLKCCCLFQWRMSNWKAYLAIIRDSVKSGTYPEKVSLVSECVFCSFLQGRPALTTPTFSVKQPSHGVQLHIPTTGPPRPGASAGKAGSCKKRIRHHEAAL